MVDNPSDYLDNHWLQHDSASATYNQLLIP